MDEPDNKKARVSSENPPIHELYDPVILNELKDKKTLFVHGKVGKEGKDAVVIVEKKPFDTSRDGLKSLFSPATELQQDLVNDIYSTYVAVPSSMHSKIKATVIYPATPKHIEKYTKQNVVVIEESEEDYKNITLPFLKSENRFSVKWVYNILSKKNESERIVFEDADPDIGFILLPDMKWDMSDTESLYLIAIPHKRGIKCLRDLGKDELPLLKNIQHQAQKAILEKYNIPRSRLRTYVHYHPSYYHFHVHFTHISFDAPGATVTRAHLLSDVIENIELMNNYYQKKTLTFVGRENDELTMALRKGKNADRN